MANYCSGTKYNVGLTVLGLSNFLLRDSITGLYLILSTILLQPCIDNLCHLRLVATTFETRAKVRVHGEGRVYAGRMYACAEKSEIFNASKHVQFLNLHEKNIQEFAYNDCRKNTCLRDKWLFGTYGRLFEWMWIVSPPLCHRCPQYSAIQCVVRMAQLLLYSYSSVNF